MIRVNGISCILTAVVHGELDHARFACADEPTTEYRHAMLNIFFCFTPYLGVFYTKTSFLTSKLFRVLHLTLLEAKEPGKHMPKCR